MGCGAARARGQLGDAPCTELSPARRVALDILLDLEESGAYARDGLDASPELRELSRRDAGLATRLVLGVVELMAASTSLSMPTVRSPAV